VVTRLLKPVPWQATLALAAVLEMLPVHSGWMLIDEFAARYVYFFAGYLFAANIFALSNWAGENRAKAAAVLVLWFVVNGLATFTPAPQLALAGEGVQFVSDLPVISLALGAAGGIAVVLFTTLLSKLPAARFLGYLGKNSIVVYLAFFLPMAATRAVLLKFAPFLDIGTVSALVTIAGVTGPVILHLLVQRTGRGRFLFERPQWAHIESPGKRKPAMALEPAE